MNEIKNKIIKNGVKNLKEFGYEGVNENNIFTDMMYSAFFKEMLKYELGQHEKMDLILN